MLIYEQSSLSWKQRRENWLCMNCASARGTIIICTISTQAENEISIIRWWERELKEIGEQFTKYTVAELWKMKFLRKSENIYYCSYFGAINHSDHRNKNGIRYHFSTIFLPWFRLTSVWKRQISVSSVKSVSLSQEFFELLVNFLYKIFVEVNRS